ncbi:uncharacterized protein LOC143010241 [Genypterus blacodes]|uniref:uncharacterized protein LOC143010241 n=1 Tax=Genypterus blacodes TaxID=154954 RepID=UPI003F76E3A4
MMGRTLLPVLQLFLLNTLLYVGLAQDAVLTLEQGLSDLFVGESVTFICDMREGTETDWYYIIKRDGNEVIRDQKYKVPSLTTGDSGIYQCKGDPKYPSYQNSKISNEITLTVSEKPKTMLVADKTLIPVGGNVTLTCSVDGNFAWKYIWYIDTAGLELQRMADVGPVITVDKGGPYWCIGKRGNSFFSTIPSHTVVIVKTVPIRAIVTLDSNWSQIFTGETVALRCEIEEGGDTEWGYEWKTNSSNKGTENNKYRIISISLTNSGHFWCRGKNRSDVTEWSSAIRVTVSYNPTPVLSVAPLWLSPGASVSLHCKVEAPFAGRRFYWFKAVPKQPDNSYSYELLPGNSNGTEEDSYVVPGPTHTAGYMCRVGRGDPVYYTHDSKLKFVWSGDGRSSASLTVMPNRVQHFTFKPIQLTCEGNVTVWRLRWSPDEQRLQCSDWHTMTRPCNIEAAASTHAVYWCEFGSGHFSNAVNITVNVRNVLLESPVHPVTEGDPVTLVCLIRSGSVISSGAFYKNNILIQNNTDGKMTIPAVSKSDEGIYKCEHATSQSLQSWMAVNSLPSENIPFLVPLIVGLVLGILLLVLLLLLCGCRGPWCHRTIQTQRTKQDSTEDVNFNCNEPQETEYSTHQHGDECVYESIKGSGDTEDDGPADESREVRCSSIQLENLTKKKGRRDGAADGGSDHTQDQCVDMGQTLLCVASLLLNVLLHYGHAKDYPAPVLSVAPLWLSPGASVSLHCEVEAPSAGWRFYWFKAVPKQTDNSYSYELLPGNSNGTEEDSYVVPGPTHTAGYMCRAGRGDPVYYTHDSKLKFVWSRDVHLAANLTVSPDSMQHFYSDPVSLSCGGESTVWMVKVLSVRDVLTRCSAWGTMSGHTCSINRYKALSGVYWCESGSGRFSNAVSITSHHGDVILVSPTHPVTEGAAVTFTCKMRTQSSTPDFDFFKNDKLIQSNSGQNLTIPAVSKSDEGFYKCKRSNEESPQSWMAITPASRPPSSSFPVLLVAGMLTGTSIIILSLLLLCGYKTCKGETIRPTMSQNTPSDSAADHGGNHSETEVNEDAAHHHGDQEESYSMLQLTHTGKKESQSETEECCVSSDVRRASTTGP